MTEESYLWRACLGQAVRDLYGDDRDRADVLLWITTPDFLTVCDFADVEPASIRDQILNLSMMSKPLAKKYGQALSKEIVGE